MTVMSVQQFLALIPFSVLELGDWGVQFEPMVPEPPVLLPPEVGVDGTALLAGVEPPAPGREGKPEPPPPVEGSEGKPEPPPVRENEGKSDPLPPVDGKDGKPVPLSLPPVEGQEGNFGKLNCGRALLTPARRTTVAVVYFILTVLRKPEDCENGYRRC